MNLSQTFFYKNFITILCLTKKKSKRPEFSDKSNQLELFRVCENSDTATMALILEAVKIAKYGKNTKLKFPSKCALELQQYHTLNLIM